MTAVEQVRQNLEHAEGQESFLKWQKDPWTQTMILAGRELAQPRISIAAPQPHEASYYLGVCAGGALLLNFFSSPRSGAEEAGSAKPRKPVPTYGAERVIAESEGEV